jgi:ABC-type phosphate transport system substrate-binding protein
MSSTSSVGNFRRSCLLMAAALLLSGIGSTGASAQSAGAAAGYKLIVNSSNPTTSLPREQVGRYFFKKVTSWPSGGTVVPVDRDKEAPVREAFSRDVLHKSVGSVVAFWQQQIFSGRGVPPVEKASDAEVVAFVEANPGAIGYVSPDAGVGDAKVVRVVE